MLDMLKQILSKKRAHENEEDPPHRQQEMLVAAKLKVLHGAP